MSLADVELETLVSEPDALTTRPMNQADQNVITGNCRQSNSKLPRNRFAFHPFNKKTSVEEILQLYEINLSKISINYAVVALAKKSNHELFKRTMRTFSKQLERFKGAR